MNTCGLLKQHKLIILIIIIHLHPHQNQHAVTDHIPSRFNEILTHAEAHTDTDTERPQGQEIELP